MKRLTNNNGFTLIELITVMVILGVVASFSTSFVVSIMRSAVTVNEQNQLLTNSQLTTGYMVRRLRNALPFSLRITNDESCLQFMPIVSSGLYLNALPSDANGAFAGGSFSPIVVSPFIVKGGQADFLAISASGSDELYGVAPSSLAAIDSITTNTITLVDDKRWLRNSINQRFYIVESPSAFCLVSNELRLYRRVGIENVLVNSTNDYDLLTLSVGQLNNTFTLSSAIEDRNIRITLSLIFSAGQHQIDTVKQVVMRNVP